MVGVVCLCMCPPLSHQLTDGPHQPSVPAGIPTDPSSQIMRERQVEKEEQKERIKASWKDGDCDIVKDEVRRGVKGQKSRLESVAKCLVTRMKQKASGRCKE